MPRDYHTTARQYAVETQACPHITPQQADQWGDRAIDDALDLITDVRDLDPRQIYGRLVHWGQTDPPRLVTACLALAAMHDPHTPGSHLGAWLTTLTTPHRNAA